MKSFALVLLLLLLGGCGQSCEGGERAIGSFPEERILEEALRVRVTDEGASFLAARLGPLLKSLLGEDELGAIRLELGAFDLNEVEVVDLGLTTIHVRDLVLGLDAELFRIHFDPEQSAIRLAADNAILGLRNGTVSFDLLSSVSDAACGLQDGLDPGSSDARAARASFSILIFLDVDEAHRLQTDAQFERFEIHEIGLDFPTDCSLEECTDGCTECVVGCPLLGGASAVTESLLTGLRGALENALANLIERALEQGTADERALLDLWLDPSKLLANSALPAGQSNPVRVLIGPEPRGVSIEEDEGRASLDIDALAGFSGRVHRCIPAPGVPPAPTSGPAPRLGDGPRDHLQLAAPAALLDAAVWAMYEAGVLCAVVDTHDLMRLSPGSSPITAGSLEALLPGISGLAGQEATIQVQLEPRLSASDFPLIRLQPDNSNSPKFEISLPTMGLSLFLRIDERFSRVLGVEAQLEVQGSIIARPDTTLELVIDELELNGLEPTYMELTPGSALGELLDFLSGAIAGGLLGSGLRIPLDLDTALSAAGLPVTGRIARLEARGAERDWLQAQINFDDLSLSAVLEAAPTRVEAPRSTTTGQPPVVHVPSHWNGRPLEYQLRLDHLPWTSFRRGRLPSLRNPIWKIAGNHVLRIRARFVDQIDSLDMKGWSGTIRALTAAAPGDELEANHPGQGGCNLSSAGSPPRKTPWWARLVEIVLLRRGPTRALGTVLSPMGCAPEPAGATLCQSTSDCPDRFTCVSGECVATQSCQRAEDCCPGQVCHAELCQDPEPCSLDEDCLGVAAQCEAGWCVRQGCSEDAHCPSDLRCLGERCVDRLPCDGRCKPGQACHRTTASCRPAPAACSSQRCGPGEILHVLEPGLRLMGSGCGWDQTGCACIPSPPLGVGEIGRHGSLALSRQGPVAVSYEHAYGDLVWLEFNAQGAPTRVESIDGVPEGMRPIADPEGYRGGIVEAGPDVGRFASLAVSEAGLTHTSYRDDTNRSLRYARREEGQGWQRHTVDAQGDAGWYSSIALDSQGRPNLLYTAIDVSGGSELRLASAATTQPNEARSWTIRVLAEGAPPPLAPAPCGDLCSPPMLCVDFEDSGPPGCALPDAPAACEPRCSVAERCVRGRCLALVGQTPAPSDLPYGTGIGSSLAFGDSGPVALWVDRTDESLWLGWFEGEERVHRRIDGPATDSEARAFGSSPTLAISPNGRVLVAYQERSKGELLGGLGDDLESLQSLSIHVPAIGRMGRFGAGAAATWLDDGGAAIVYQDSFDNDLWIARMDPAGGWVRQALQMEGAVGYHNDLLQIEGQLFVYTNRLGYNEQGRSIAAPWLLRLDSP